MGLATLRLPTVRPPSCFTRPLAMSPVAWNTAVVVPSESVNVLALGSYFTSSFMAWASTAALAKASTLSP